jgi:hypothetical protein
MDQIEVGAALARCVAAASTDFVQGRNCREFGAGHRWGIVGKKPRRRTRKI